MIQRGGVSKCELAYDFVKKSHAMSYGAIVLLSFDTPNLKIYS